MEKQAMDAAELRQTRTLHDALVRANIPVAWIKARKQRYRPPTGAKEKVGYFLVNEDLTEQGVYELCELQGWLPFSRALHGRRESIPVEHIPLSMKKNIIRALAVMHNNGIYVKENHNGSSFALRLDLAKSRERDKPIFKDFYVIDYDNFDQSESVHDTSKTIQADPEGWIIARDRTRKDLTTVLDSISFGGQHMQELTRLHSRLIEEGIKQY